MKVLLRRNVMRLGKIGDVVDVKSGYARNYLLPQELATAPSKLNVAAVEAEKQKYLEEMAKQHKEIQARADQIRGKEITIPARANEEGQLYGSVGPAQIVAALAEEGMFVEARDIVLADAIRRLDKYDVDLEFAEDIKATIHVWIVPIRDLIDEEGEPIAQPAAADLSETESTDDSETTL